MISKFKSCSIYEKFINFEIKYGSKITLRNCYKTIFSMCNNLIESV